MQSTGAKSPVSFSIGKIAVGAKAPLFLIAGPCVIESEAHAMSMAEHLAKIAGAVKVPLIFKASYDKANRSSVTSYRGPGTEGRAAHFGQDKEENGIANPDRRA